MPFASKIKFVLSGIILFLIVLLYTIYNFQVFLTHQYKNTDEIISLMNRERSPIKYILQWPDKSLSPFNWMGEGNSTFIRYNCEYKNCFVTDDPNYFIEKPDQNFDAIVFNGRKVVNMLSHEMPRGRLHYQKYIFGMMESPVNCPACDKYLDGFFNWTWTYRLDSDFRWGYFTIYDLDGNIVGPKINMQWHKNLQPINEELKQKLSKKSKAVAWFVSNCITKSKREDFADEVNKELQAYGWSVDIFGKCGSYKCSKDNKSLCFKMIENEYYFYFAFENSFSQDYVTEKLINALNNYAVPVVFGGADYSRFLPDGSYLDGRKLGPPNLARTMDQIIKNKTMYYEFFRWRNHYVYKDTTHNTDICNLCAMLNDEKVEQMSVWTNFRSWWNDNHNMCQDKR